MKKIFSILIFIALNINVLLGQIPSECSGGTLLFSEDFSGDESQWTKAWGRQGASAANAFFGISNGKFMVRSARGQTPCGTGGGGMNDNYLTSIPINISAYQGGAVHLSYDISVQGKMEGLNPDGTFWGMGTDEVVGEYSTNNGSLWNVANQFYGDGCNGCSTNDAWTADYHISECVNLPQTATNFIIRMKMGNQSANEYYYLDNVTLTGLFPITGANAVSRGSTIQLNNATPNGTWSSSNNAVATVSQSGIVTGIAQGTATIRYSIGCCEVEFVVNVTQETPDPELPDNIFDVECSETPQPTPFNIRLAKTYQTIHSHQPPLVGDFDRDGHTDVLLSTHPTNNISGLPNGFVILKEPNFDASSAIIRYTDTYKFCGISTARIKFSAARDTTLIFMVRDSDNKLIAYNINGVRVWQSNTAVFVPTYSSASSGRNIGIADFNNDGYAEVYIGNQIFDAATGIELCNGGNSNTKGLVLYSNYAHGLFSIAANVIGDEKLELCAGSMVYSVNIASRTNPALNSMSVAKQVVPVVNSTNLHRDGATVVADFDNDGELEILVQTQQNATSVGNSGYLYIWKPQTQQILAMHTLTNARQRGVPSVGDINGDGKPEIIIITSDNNQSIVPMHIRAFQLNGNSLTQLWQKNHNDESGSVGVALFDFNNDGLLELVYRDNTNLKILDSNGNVIYSMPAYSGTVYEYPTIADIDGDGEAEILATSALDPSNSALNTNAEFHIYKSNGNAWAAARKVWNQYSYNSVNVNEDLTIPRHYFNPATKFAGADGILGNADDIQPFNCFLQQQKYLNQNGMPFVEIVFRDTLYLPEQCQCGCPNELSVGTHYLNDTLSSQNGCDSIITTILTIKPFNTKILTETICSGDSIYFNEIFIKTAGTYFDTIPSNSNDCDTIVTLNLTIANIRDIVYDDMCAGHQYEICGCIWESGTHYVNETISAENGCDTIRTHVVTILPRETKTINRTICNGDSIYFNDIFIKLAGTYTDTILSNSAGCDTIATLNLTLEDCSNITIEPFAEICADEEFITLNYRVLEGGLYCYSTIFNEKEISAGFKNDTCKTPFSNTEIRIKIPQFPNSYVRPDNYSMKIEFEFSDGTTETYTLNFSILYPAWVMNQKWNDVIALLNEHYNGGYLWSAYEWYLDNAPIPNENYSYIYVGLHGDILKMGHEYRALLTRVGENYGIFTCPLIPAPRTDETIFPTIVGSNTRFSILSKSAVRVSIISVTGIKIADYQLNIDVKTEIAAPSVAGVYILLFENKNGEIRSEKIVVK